MIEKEESTPGLPDELWEELAEGGRKWTPKDKIRAVAVYVNFKSFVRASKDTNIPRETIMKWAKKPWWLKVVHEFYRHYNEEHIATLSRTMLVASEKLLDRVVNGEYVYDKDTGRKLLEEDGTIIRQELKTHTLAVDCLAIPIDKLAVMRGFDTKKSTDSDRNMLKDCQDDLIAISKASREAAKADQEARIIEHETESK